MTARGQQLLSPPVFWVQAHTHPIRGQSLHFQDCFPVSAPSCRTGLSTFNFSCRWVGSRPGVHRWALGSTQLPRPLNTQVSPGAHIDPLSSQPTVRTDVSVDAMRGTPAWVPHGEFEKKGSQIPWKEERRSFFLLTAIFKNLCLVWRSREIFLAEDAERAEVERGERGRKWRPSDSRGTRTWTGRQTGLWGLF